VGLGPVGHGEPRGNHELHHAHGRFLGRPSALGQLGASGNFHPSGDNPVDRSRRAAVAPVDPRHSTPDSRGAGILVPSVFWMQASYPDGHRRGAARPGFFAAVRRAFCPATPASGPQRSTRRQAPKPTAGMLRLASTSLRDSPTDPWWPAPIARCDASRSQVACVAAGWPIPLGHQSRRLASRVRRPVRSLDNHSERRVPSASSRCTSPGKITRDPWRGVRNVDLGGPGAGRCRF
jgi:hypothetical protein